MPSTLSPAASVHFQRRNLSLAASRQPETPVSQRELKFVPFHSNIPGATVFRSTIESPDRKAPTFFASENNASPTAFLPSRSTKVFKENYGQNAQNGAQSARGHGAIGFPRNGYPSDPSNKTCQVATHQKVQSVAAPTQGRPMGEIQYIQYSNAKVPIKSSSTTNRDPTSQIRTKKQALQTSSNSSVSTSSTKTSSTEKQVVHIPPPPPSQPSTISSAPLTTCRRSGATGVSSYASHVGLHKRHVSLANNPQAQHHRSSISGYHQNGYQATASARNYPEVMHTFQRMTTTVKTPPDQPSVGEEKSKVYVENGRHRPIVTKLSQKGYFFAQKDPKNADDTSPSFSANGVESFVNVPFAPQWSHTSLSSYIVDAAPPKKQSYTIQTTEEPNGSLHLIKNFPGLQSKKTTNSYERGPSAGSASNTRSKLASVEQTFTPTVSQTDIDEQETPFASEVENRRTSSSDNSCPFSPLLRKAVKDLPDIQMPIEMEVVDGTTEIELIFALAMVYEQLSANASANSSPTRFHAVQAPDITIPEYLDRIWKYFACSKECFVLSLIYLDRIIKQHMDFTISILNIHRLLVTSILLATKFFDDVYYSNAFYARVGGVKTKEINSLELHFLKLIHYELYVSPEEYEKYKTVVYKYKCFLYSKGPNEF